jgi:signal transduction histidine kinase
MSEGKTVDTGQEDGLHELIAAAHELKTPLTLIAQLAASIEEELIGVTPAERKLGLKRIRLSAQRTLRLVDGLTVGHRLQNYSQLAMPFALEPINVTQMCEEAIDELLPFAASSAQSVRLFAPGHPELVVGNRELLRSVFFNLIDNAIKHSPAEASVSVRVRRRGTHIRVCVQDTGPGVKPGDLNYLRSTLGRELQPLRSRPGSSGLGLYIAGQMAQAMGGHLGIGVIKQGSDFHVDLLYSNQLSLL